MYDLERFPIQGSLGEFQRQQEPDGPLLWNFIRRRVQPSTTVGASRLKDEIENKTLADFGHNVIRYNTWFEDTRKEIVKEEGDGYNEYLRSLFKGYLTSNSTEFKETISAEKRDWQQGRSPPSYSHRDLMDVGRIAYNNLVCEGAWKTATFAEKGTEEEKSKNFLALITERVDRLEKISGNNPSGTPTGGKHGNGDFTQNPGWRYHNPNGEKTKLNIGRHMTWCDKDCHKRPMWCGRKVCYGKAEFAARNKKQEEAKKGGDQKKDSISKDFRIALAALTTAEDLAALEEEFFQVKE